MLAIQSLKQNPHLKACLNDLFVSFKNHLEQVYQITPNFYTGDFLPEIEKYAQNPHTDAFILYIDNQPVGCVAYHAYQPNKAEIKRLYVLPAHQRQGYAKRLMHHVLNAIESEGVFESVLLDTEARLGLQAFYESFGFQSTDPYHEIIYDGMLYFERPVNTLLTTT